MNDSTSTRQPAPDTVTLSYRSAGGRRVLFATALGSGLVAADLTVASVALPAIGREFSVGIADLQWVFTAYTLTLAGLLLVGGALGDRYGRRRVFLVGVVWFAVASLLCALAPDAPGLVAARALAGAGGALLTPGSLAILETSFVPADRGKAIGAWSGCAGVAAAIGPFLGGWLVQVASWRTIFYLNLPLAAAVVLVTWRYVPESRAPGAAERVDVPGAALVTVGLAGLTYGLIEGAAHGWSALPVAALLVGVALLIAFVGWEWQHAAPMLPLGVFASARFSVANAVTFAVYAAVGGAMFLLPIQLQQAAGYTPLQAGTALLPVTVVILLLSSRSAALTARVSPRLQVAAGPVVLAVGLALFARIDRRGDYLTEVLPAVLVFAIGFALTVAPLTMTAMSAAPPEHAGVASAVTNDVARVANLVAVAVLPAAAGLTGMVYVDPDRFSAGFGTASLIAAGLAASGGLLGAAAIGGRRVAPTGPGPLAGHVHCALDAPPLRRAGP